ncbi:MAG: helix-hairpin-helix domain-containing protein [Planctomycetota bacterium]
MGAGEQGKLGKPERRSFVVGALALLFVVVLLARYHVTSVDHQYAPSDIPGVRINVNTADETTLALLHQIGPERARQIVLHRERYGPFKTFPDLMRVQGIGLKTVEGLVDQVCFSDPE